MHSSGVPISVIGERSMPSGVVLNIGAMPSTVARVAAGESVSMVVKIMLLMRIFLPSRPWRAASSRRNFTFDVKASSVELGDVLELDVAGLAGVGDDVHDVGVLRGDAQEALAAAAEQDRRRRLLHRLRPEDAVVELVELALEGRLVLRPERAHAR